MKNGIKRGIKIGINRYHAALFSGVVSRPEITYAMTFATTYAIGITALLENVSKDQLPGLAVVSPSFDGLESRNNLINNDANGFGIMVSNGIKRGIMIPMVSWYHQPPIYIGAGSDTICGDRTSEPSQQSLTEIL
jgi:hypothetical protein